MRGDVMRHVVALVLVLGTAAAAQAGMTCQFGSECFEEDGCTFTQFGLALEEGEAGAQLVTDAGTVPGSLATPEAGGALFQGADATGAWQMVTAPGGMARLAVQYFEGPMMITYFGQCEDD